MCAAKSNFVSAFYKESRRDRFVLLVCARGRGRAAHAAAADASLPQSTSLDFLQTKRRDATLDRSALLSCALRFVLLCVALLFCLCEPPLLLCECYAPLLLLLLSFAILVPYTEAVQWGILS